EPSKYRNRVSYGSRVAIRLGPQHTVVLHVPTSQMSDTGPTDPKPADLVSFQQIASCLGRLTSSAHDNALLPVSLTNRAVSLGDSPSNRILDDYLNQVLN